MPTKENLKAVVITQEVNNARFMEIKKIGYAYFDYEEDKKAGTIRAANDLFQRTTLNKILRKQEAQEAGMISHLSGKG